MAADSLFFPRLTRRSQYRSKRGGGYYADYREYRQEIREDCLGRCVYCDLHENDLAGPEDMCLDHFRPQRHFDGLANHPHNLVWSCHSCNRKKADHWPALGTDGASINNEGFLDAFEEDRRDYLSVRPDGKVAPLKPPAAYIIALLILNRSSRRLRRRARFQAHSYLPTLRRKISELQRKTSRTKEDEEALDVCRRFRTNLAATLDFSLRDG